jgi:hypothetical protein
MNWISQMHSIREVFVDRSTKFSTWTAREETAKLQLLSGSLKIVTKFHAEVSVTDTAHERAT